MPASHERRRALFWMTLFLGAAAMLALIRRGQASHAGHFTPTSERRAGPVAAFPLLDGGQWALADHQGQVVLINTWATWCEPCQEELPGLARVAREFGPRGLAVLGVSVDAGPSAPAQVRAFAARYRLPYPIAFGASPDPALLMVPTTLLLDRRGRVVKTYAGAVPAADFRVDVAALLGEQ